MSMKSPLYFDNYVMQKMMFEHVFQVQLILVLSVLMYQYDLSILVLKTKGEKADCNQSNHWQSLTIIGNHWQSLAIIDNHWQSLTIIGNHWQSLTIFDNHWQSLTIIDNQKYFIFNHFLRYCTDKTVLFGPVWR